jgi:hypothetical protein
MPVMKGNEPLERIIVSCESNVKFAKSKQLQGPAHIAARGKCK